jgi:hypothetical protein
MFYFGLDLGQTTDPSALIILHPHDDGDETIYDVRHIEQYPLGTPYPQLVAAVGPLLDRAPLAGDSTLIIDHTGVGRPLFDMFLAKHRQPIGVTITGGVSWHIDPENRQQWHVSKIMLVGTVQRFLQSGRLRIGARLPHAATLQKELRDFRVKISKAAHETYESREGAHDDLVLALAIALFVAENQGPPAADVDPGTMERIWAQASGKVIDGINGMPRPRRRWGSRLRGW